MNKVSANPSIIGLFGMLLQTPAPENLTIPNCIFLTNLTNVRICLHIWQTKVYTSEKFI